MCIWVINGISIKKMLQTWRVPVTIDIPWSTRERDTPGAPETFCVGYLFVKEMSNKKCPQREASASL